MTTGTFKNASIGDFEVLNHGIDYPDYFQGCGLGGADDCATGCGSSEAEALEDALEQLASSGRWDLDGLDDRLTAKYGKPSSRSVPESYGEDAYRYLTVRLWK